MRERECCADVYMGWDYRQIKRPTLSTQTKKLYYQGPPQLREQTAPNLEKKLKELITSGEEVWLTYYSIPSHSHIGYATDIGYCVGGHHGPGIAVQFAVESGVHMR